MQNVILLLLMTSIASSFLGCSKEPVVPAVDGNGLSLYWDHEVFGENGRRYRFELSTRDKLDEQYELIFQPTISGNTITARLMNTVDKGKCPEFPGWGTSCTSRGGFELSEKDVPPGTYTFRLVTPNFSENGQLTVSADRAVLDLGGSQTLTTTIREVFPIPRQILFGTIVYAGSGNTQAAKDFITYLSSLGVTATSVPDVPYRHLTVSQASHLMTKDWPDDNHSISLLYSMNRNFRDIFQDVKTYYEKTDKKLSIFLYTSQGDQSRLSGSESFLLYGAP